MEISHNIYDILDIFCLQVAGLALIPLDVSIEFASKVKCEYMNIKAVPGMVFDHPDFYTTVLDKLKESASRYEYKEVEGTHHVHMNEPEKIAPIIFDFIKSSKPEKPVPASSQNGSASST